MVLPHLPKQRGVELGAREDEGWEAVAMREELTDVMLHTAFGDAILKEVRVVCKLFCAVQHFIFSRVRVSLEGFCVREDCSRLSAFCISLACSVVCCPVVHEFRLAFPW